ncbi:MAG TPA: hypothetical protein VK648_05800 [Gemmatimonadaceae bacterium]|nr:MAG: hypothetical protein DMF56_02330 [Acidobacteriota bacterium]HTD83290.1 hypothetical protein [Gemmatimonadaceae bacterium]
MTDAELRTRIGLFWVITHFAIIATIIVCFFLGGYEFPDMTTLLAIVVPMFAGITTVVIRYFAQHRHDAPRGKRVNAAYVTLTWLLPVLFSMTIALTIILRALNRAFEDFDQAKLFLTALEALYVTYTGYLLAPLFGVEPDALRSAQETKKSPL